MKKILIIAMALCLAMAGSAFAGSVTDATSKHNLSKTSTGSFAHATEYRVCVFCHTPHSTASNMSAVPLWNHNLTDSGETFVMYTSPSMDMTLANAPAGVSKACLSCHDGVSSVGVTLKPTGTPGKGVMTGTVAIGLDLTNDHPISITYLDTQDSGAFQSLNTVQNDGDVVLYGTQSAPGTFNQVECGSCHTAHDYGSGTTVPFLRSTNASSALCLNCHIK